MKKLSFMQSILAGASAAGVAAFINAILFYVTHAAGIITDDILVNGQPMTVLPVIISSVMPTLIASIVFFLTEKFTDNGFGIFRILSIILLVLSFANPFMAIPNVPIGYAVALNVMHVVVVGALLYFIGKTKNAASL